MKPLGPEADVQDAIGVAGATFLLLAETDESAESLIHEVLLGSGLRVALGLAHQFIIEYDVGSHTLENTLYT